MTVVKNATILAPPAIGFFGRPSAATPIPEAVPDAELIKFYQQEIRRLEAEVEKHRIATTTIANAAACLLHERVDDSGEASYVINAETRAKMAGTSITVGETADGGKIVRLRTRLHNPGWESA